MSQCTTTQGMTTQYGEEFPAHSFVGQFQPNIIDFENILVRLLIKSAFKWKIFEENIHKTSRPNDWLTYNKTFSNQLTKNCDQFRIVPDLKLYFKEHSLTYSDSQMAEALKAVLYRTRRPNGGYCWTHMTLQFTQSGRPAPLLYFQQQLYNLMLDGSRSPLSVLSTFHSPPHPSGG